MSNVASGANWQKKSKAGVESHRAKTSQRKHVRECGFGPTVSLPETETNAVTDRFLGSYEVVAVCLLLFTTAYGRNLGTGEIHSHFHTICIHH